MKVELDFKQGICKITKENGDPYFKNTNWSDAESTFLHYVKKELIKQGYDIIKKRMWKDDHMVDDRQQYVRTRKWTVNGNEDEFCIYNNFYSILNAGEEFNEKGEYILNVLTGELNND
jgi:hypothetical protein